MGLEPATTPLTVEELVICAPGSVKLLSNGGDPGRLRTFSPKKYPRPSHPLFKCVHTITGRGGVNSLARPDLGRFRIACEGDRSLLRGQLFPSA